jgi:hypothetical protein
MWFEHVRRALVSKEVSDPLVSNQPQPLRLSLLNMSVENNNLDPLVEKLNMIKPTIQQLKNEYCGHGKELHTASAAVASLGRESTMDITVYENDHGGRCLSTWLHRLCLAVRLRITVT